MQDPKPWERYRQQEVVTKPADPTLPYQGEVARNEAAASAYDPALAALEARLKEQELLIRGRELEDKQQERIDQQEASQGQEENVRASVQNILGIVRDARILAQKGGTGYGSLLTPLPESDARNLSALLDTIKANLAFDRLQAMRDASKTGGALGQVSERELNLLMSAVASLDQGQSQENFLANLERIEKHYSRFGAALSGFDPDTKDGEKFIANVNNPFAEAEAGQQEEIEIGIAKRFATDEDRRFAALAQQAFDNGASAAEINGLAQEYGYAPYGNDLSEAIKYRDSGGKGAVISAPQSGYDDPSIIDRVRHGMADNAFGAFMHGAANGALFGGLDELKGAGRTIFQGGDLGENIAEENLRKKILANAHPGADLAGNIAGGALGALTLQGATGARAVSTFAPRALAADAAYGAAYGLGENNEDRAKGAVAGAVAGPLGGVAGRAVTRKLGQVVGGLDAPNARELRERGVRLTTGQVAGDSGGMFGRMVKGKEDRLAGYGGIGDVIGQRRREGYLDFNRAAFDEALEPIGATSGEIAEEGVDGAQGAVRAAYRRALDGKTFTPDAPLAADLGRAQRTGDGLMGELAGEFDNTMATRIDPFVNQPTFSGRDFQAMQQGLRRDASALSGKPRFDIYQQASGEAEDALAGLVQRQSPDALPQFQAANQAYRQTGIVRDAVAKGLNTDGIFSPAQLGMAARTNAKKFGNAHGTTRQPFFELQRAGQSVLPSTVPDSGTAGRIGAGDGILGTVKAGMRNARMPLYSEPAQSILVSAMLDRPEVLRRAGQSIINGQRVGGMFGAPYLMQYPNDLIE